MKIPDGGKCLDVGCGSGALSIAVAKRNPNAQDIGIDRWGKEYASFSKNLCESNSAAEGVSNTSFQQGGDSYLLFLKHTLTSMDTMLKLFLIKHILIKTVLVKRIISGRNNYVYRKRT